MSYPLPSIFIAPRRAERMAERADQRATELYVQLRDELQTALMTDPQIVVSTPGFKAGGRMTAAEVLMDDLAGVDADERVHTLVRLLADAAKGEDVHLRAAAYIADLAQRHAEFHHGDALLAEEF
jgi:hypothetical protein